MGAKRAKSPKRASRKKKARIFCYTGDLIDVLEVTRRTVYKYVQAGLLPAPILYSDGRTGVQCRWTLAAIDHAYFINEQKSLGFSLTVIKAMIAARWGTQERPPVKAAHRPQNAAATGNSPGDEPPSA